MIRRENVSTATTVTTTTATTTITTTAEQLDKANQILCMAIASNEQRRKELLEQALLAYADTLPYADPIIARAILEKIHAIEQWLELLINESSSISISNSGNNSNSNNSNDWL